MPTASVDGYALQRQIDSALEKISQVSQEIRQVSSENAILRQEIHELQQALVLPESA
jgi:peptidoglycan hydrolase CwlO-like protein